MGMAMEMDEWEWDGMGILIVFPHTSTPWPPPVAMLQPIWVYLFSWHFCSVCVNLDCHVQLGTWEPLQLPQRYGASAVIRSFEFNQSHRFWSGRSPCTISYLRIIITYAVSRTVSKLSCSSVQFSLSNAHLV